MRAGVVVVLLLASTVLPTVDAAEDKLQNPFRLSDAPPRTIAYGKYQSSHFAPSWAFDGQGVQRFPLCVGVDLEPPTEIGQIISAGVMGNSTKFGVEFGEFNWTDPHQQGGVAENLKLFGGTGWGDLPLPEFNAVAAAWGNATLWVDDELYPDPITFVPNDEEHKQEPAPGDNFTAFFALIDRGVRDNQSKMVLTQDRAAPFDPSRPLDAFHEAGDWEAHLILRNHSTETPNGKVRLVEYGPTIDDTHLVPPPASHVSEDRDFENWWWYGQAKITFRLWTVLPSLAASKLDVKVIGPDQQVLRRLTLGGGVTPEDVKSVDILLDQLFSYSIELEGDLRLASWQITYDVTPPAELLLNFWWEDLMFGPAATVAADECRHRFGGETEPLPRYIDVAQPPGIKLELVALGLAACLLAGLFTIKIVLDQVSIGAFKRGFRRR